MEADEHSFEHIFKSLQQYIKLNYSVEAYSDSFLALNETKDKVCMAYHLLEEANLLPEKMSPHPKSSLESSNFREKGNKEFLKKQDLLAIQTFSVSAAFAPPNSEELALAFANRSAVTFSIKEYSDCIQDIDRALGEKYPKHLRYKLYERKGKCLKCLGMDRSARDLFEKALDCVESSDLSKDKVKDLSISLTKQLNSCSEKDNPIQAEHQCLPCLSDRRSDKILSASSLVRIEHTEGLGRHLVATTTIEPGDVLVIEKPFASILLPSSYNNFCFHCKKRCHSLLPCSQCVVAMYCSEVCRSNSWKENHEIECGLVPLLVALDFTKIEMIALRTLLMATKQFKSLPEFLSKIPEIESDTDPKTKGTDENGLYDSDNYRTVHHLVGNLEMRSNADVFRRAATAAYMLHLLDKNTEYFAELPDDNSKKDILKDDCFENVVYLNKSKYEVGGLLFRYLLIVPSNAHEISEMFVSKVKGRMVCESVEVGGGLYPVLSLINHSCDPNVVRHSHVGDLNVLTAIQVIYPGQQIFDNYSYHHAMHDLATRDSKLWSQYHFHCQCVACVEDWPVYAELPSVNPVFLNPSLKDEVEKSSEIFEDVLAEVKEGKLDKQLGFLLAHLCLLHRSVQRPWKQYSECQEAIKQCLSLQANHYIAY